jgi:hypothetical protein
MTEKQAPYWSEKEKEQTIFRVNKNAENPFVMMDKRPIENDNLSWKAKGLLSYLLSRPDNWTVRMKDLVKRSSDGDFSTRSAIKELIEAGHLERSQGRAAGAKFDTVSYDVYEIPKPLRGFPQADNPQADNPALNKIDSNKKDLSNIPAPEEARKATSIQEAIFANQPITEDMLQDDSLAQEIDLAVFALCQGAPHYEELARAFMESRGIALDHSKSKVSGHRKAFREMYNAHVKPEHIRAVFRNTEPHILKNIIKPIQIVTMAIGEANALPGVVDNDQDDGEVL